MRAKCTGYMYKPHESATKRVCDIAKHANLDIKKGKLSLNMSCKKNLSVLLTAEYCVVYINVQIYIIFP